MTRWLGFALLSGCTQIYGLDSTKVTEALPDLDRDNAPDVDDNCPGVANPEQQDRDDDGFGDACDFCPDLATTRNHDEDADAHGDECDVCPIDPDFQIDADKDGVGDTCDNDFANKNTRLLFDPFIELGSHWEQAGTWSLLGDAVGAMEPGATLNAPAIALGGGMQAAYEVSIGVTATGPFVPGDHFALELVDDAGVVIAGCAVDCAFPSNCQLTDLASNVSATFGSYKPFGSFLLRRNPFRQVCIYMDQLTDDPDVPRQFARAHVRLVGSPKIQFRYIAVTQ